MALGTLHGEPHHCLIFPRNVDGSDSAIIILLDAGAERQRAARSGRLHPQLRTTRVTSLHYFGGGRPLRARLLKMACMLRCARCALVLWLAPFAAGAQSEARSRSRGAFACRPQSCSTLVPAASVDAPEDNDCAYRNGNEWWLDYVAGSLAWSKRRKSASRHRRHLRRRRRDRSSRLAQSAVDQRGRSPWQARQLTTTATATSTMCMAGTSSTTTPLPPRRASAADGPATAPSWQASSPPNATAASAWPQPAPTARA